MKGHHALIAMRLRGRHPKAVFIEPDEDIGGISKHWQEHGTGIATLVLEPGENIGRLDLRCVMGLRVHLHTTTEQRITALVAACLEAGAAQVIGITDEEAIVIATEGATTWHR